MARSGKKVWLWIVGILVFLGIGGYVGWQFIKKDMSKPNSKVEQSLSEQFAEMITDASDSLYRVSYSKFDVNIDSGRGTISDFKLIPDSQILARLVKENRAPNNVLNVAVKSLVLADLKIQNTDKGMRMNLNRMLIDSPSITVYNTLRAYNISSEEKKHGKLFSLMQQLLKMSNIQSMSMRNMTFTYVNQNYDKPKRTAMKKISIDMSGLTAVELDSAGRSGSQIRVKHYRLATRDSLYLVTADDISFLPDLKKATIKRLELSPRLTKTAFYRHLKSAKDRVYILSRDVVLNNIDLNRFLQKQQLHIGSMNLGYSMVEVYNNYNYPRRLPEVRSNPYPSQQLKLLAFDMTIDTMRIKNSDTYYRVLAMKSDQVSSLNINDNKGVILNVTNNKEYIARNKYMSASLRSKVMGAAPMKVDMKFNLADKDGAFTYESTMGSADATIFNRFAEPFSLMAVKSGTINKMYLHFSANEYTAKGNLDYYYKDMKYALLKKDDKADELKERKVVSALSNLMLPNDNPTKGGKFKEGPINITRPANMCFFGLLSKVMLDGMTSSTTGMEQKKKNPESNIILEAGEAITGGAGKKARK